MRNEPDDLTHRLAQFERRALRERTARLEAEGIAERATRVLYDKQRQLLLLQRTTAAANESATLPEAMERVLHEVCAFTGWPLGHGYVRSRVTPEVFLPINRVHAPQPGANAPERFERFWEQTKHVTFRTSEGLPGRVALHGKPAWIVEVTEDPNFPRAQAADQAGLHSAFAFPVLSGSKVEGVLEFFSIEATPPDDALLDAMATIGAQIGRVAEREVYAEQLEHSNRELQDFAYVASHDLQEPLRKIHTFAEMLDTSYRKQMDEESAHFLDRIQDAAQRMSRLIRDLLALSRVATTPRDFVAVDLNATLHGVLIDLEARIRETHGQVQVDGSLPTVCADPTQMHQLLLNLIGNALKFSRPGTLPVVSIAATVTSGTVRLVIEDNGIGFDPQQAARIFRPFQRLHTKDQYEGTGIGLALVHRIAERHGGAVEATATPDVGSRFVVTLAGQESY